MSESDDALRELLAGLSDDELKKLGADIGVDISLPEESDPHRPLKHLTDRELRQQAADKGVEIEVNDDPISPDEAKRAAGLVTARSLVENPDDLDQGDFEPGLSGMLYKGFRIIPEAEWPEEAHRLPAPGVAGHANQKRRFYVEAIDGTIGLVPWEGSQVVWPWESGWDQDMYRPEVTSLLKEDKEKKKQR